MTNALEIYDLHKTYKNGVQALCGINLEVKQGDFFALLGPNGAGKSTAIGIISSLVNKTSGTVKVFGHDIDDELEKAKSFIGLVPQEFNFNQFEPTIEIVVNQAGYYGISRKLAYQRAEKYLKQLGLWEKRYVIGRELSGGMKRRLMIARALVHEPRILILDEPTAGVDIEIRRSMWTFLKEINAQGTTIILTTHYLEEAESLCKNIAIINNGVVIENTGMQTLLAKLHIETFVLNTEETLQDKLEGWSDDAGCNVKQIDDSTFEVEISKKYSLNNLFAELDKRNINISSLRSKSNRLEELFVHLVEEGTL
ncbi:MAG: ABC transporter ATP-binding protein [Gammaproteobacteria bacterium]|nr:ABC transporter ATP-binding protein [Gammaproteobacteria bacterium]MDH5659608.1 ABC transporter ATP-binding protein [Gammaproteobacteria bacterium]